LAVERGIVLEIGSAGNIEVVETDCRVTCQMDFVQELARFARSFADIAEVGEGAEVVDIVEMVQ